MWHGIFYIVYFTNHTDTSIGVVAFMLLASALPFYGKERKQVAMQILHNKYSFGGRRWQFVSSKAQTFIRDLLVTNPDHRDDAEHALKSPWLKGILQTGSSENGGGHRVPRTEEEELARSSILRYASYSKLKKMVRPPTPGYVIIY